MLITLTLMPRLHLGEIKKGRRTGFNTLTAKDANAFETSG